MWCWQPHTAPWGAAVEACVPQRVSPSSQIDQSALRSARRLEQARQRRSTLMPNTSVAPAGLRVPTGTSNPCTHRRGRARCSAQTHHGSACCRWCACSPPCACGVCSGVHAFVGADWIRLSPGSHRGPAHAGQHSAPPGACTSKGRDCSWLSLSKADSSWAGVPALSTSGTTGAPLLDAASEYKMKCQFAAEGLPVFLSGMVGQGSPVANSVGTAFLKNTIN